MRISDWSSDVCSSDLGSFANEVGAGVIGDPGGVLLLLLLLLLLIVVPAFAGMTIWKVGSQLNLRAYRFNNRPSQCRGDTAFVPVPFSASSPLRSEEHTSELQSLMRTSYAVFCLKKKKN